MSGQSGAGKTTVRETVLAEINDPNGFIIVDPDEIRVNLSLETINNDGTIKIETYHDLMAANDKTAAAKLQPQTKKIADALYEWAIKNNYNVLDDRSLGSPEVDSERFRKLKEESSHEIHLQVNAISAKELISQVSILYRYEEQKARIGVGRFVPPAHHERAYDNTLPTLEVIEERKLCDFIKVYKRLPELAPKLICDRRLQENHEWINTVGEKSASETLREERERDYTDDEIAEFRTMIQKIKEWQTTRNASDEEKRYVEKLGEKGNDRFELEQHRRNWNVIEEQTGISPSQFVTNLAEHDNDPIRALGGSSAVHNTSALAETLEDKITNRINLLHPTHDDPVIRDLSQSGGRIPPNAIGWFKEGPEGEEKRFVLIDYETGSPRYTIITRQQASKHGGRMVMYEKDIFKQENLRKHKGTKFVPARGDRTALPAIAPHDFTIKKNKVQRTLDRVAGNLKSAKASVTGNIRELMRKRKH